MSLVGPRPLPCEESEECEDWQRRRLSVTPGLTCIWQVSGGMKIPFVEWMRMDIRYLRSRRLLHDIKLLWATLLAVLFHRASH
jgi:lipopolysaccharide/colanic/teichoic acid biosynthesis glycosyltransferase